MKGYGLWLLLGVLQLFTTIMALVFHGIADAVCGEPEGNPNFEEEQVGEVIGIGASIQSAGVVVLLSLNECTQIDQLQATIDSITASSYREDRKLLLMMIDANHRIGSRRTCEVLSQLLRLDMHLSCDVPYSLNDEQSAFVYSGTYSPDQGRLKYILVVTSSEIDDDEAEPSSVSWSDRNSILFFLALLSRSCCDEQNPMTDLDWALTECFYQHHLPLRYVDYILAMKVGSSIENEAISNLIYNMEQEPTCLAACGATTVAVNSNSMVYSIQLLRHFCINYISTSVTCLCNAMPGFPQGRFGTLYRVNIPLEKGRVQSIAHRSVLQRFMEQNISLEVALLQNFSNKRLEYIPMAKGKATVPSSWSTLIQEQQVAVQDRCIDLLSFLFCTKSSLSMKCHAVWMLLLFVLHPAVSIYSVACLVVLMRDVLDPTCKPNDMVIPVSSLLLLNGAPVVGYILAKRNFTPKSILLSLFGLTVLNMMHVFLLITGNPNATSTKGRSVQRIAPISQMNEHKRPTLLDDVTSVTCSSNSSERFVKIFSQTTQSRQTGLEPPTHQT